MLTGYLSLIAVIVSVLYAVVDSFYGVFHAFPGYVILAIVPLICLYFIRQQKYKHAKVLLMVAGNLVVFWSALLDLFDTGVFMLFVPAGIGSFALFAFRDFRWGLSLAVLTTLLFFTAYFGNIDLPFRMQNGSEAYINVSFVMNYAISISVSVLIVYFLMSLNRYSESELIQKEKLANEKNIELRKVNDELDHFVYSVSHDLRSPLSSILGLINVAKLSKEPGELLTILGMIEGRVSAQDRFIREIIDYSRNARTEVRKSSFSLHDVVEQILENFRFMTNYNKISVRNKIGEDEQVDTDKTRLSIIMSNLLENAIKYHDLSKPEPFVDIEFNRSAGCIIVRDNGSGIPEEFQDRIFDMFFRASDTSSGSGLGLFITKESVRKMGGAIEVSSRYKEGTEFRVFLQSPTS